MIHHFFKFFLSLPCHSSRGTPVVCVLDTSCGPTGHCSFFFFFKTFFFLSQSFVLDSFYCCILKLTDLFFYSA